MLIAYASPQTERLKQTALVSTVLCYGHNRILLYTRQQILRQLGCTTETVSRSAEYRENLLRWNPIVVVLCQTLTLGECDDAIDFAAESRPQTRLLMMYTHTLPALTKKRCFALASNNGPEVFAHNVRRMLQDRSN